jgi:hypothetical protein
MQPVQTSAGNGRRYAPLSAIERAFGGVRRRRPATPAPEPVKRQENPAGPVAAARTWFALIRGKGDLAAAWPLTDPALRRSAVEGWLAANSSHPALEGQDGAALIDALNIDRPTHRLWERFADTQLREFATTWSNVDLRLWGWASKPRPYAPDYEIAVLFEGDGEPGVEDACLKGLQLILHHVAGRGWLVAGFAGPMASVPRVM